MMVWTRPPKTSTRRLLIWQNSPKKNKRATDDLVYKEIKETPYHFYIKECTIKIIDKEGNDVTRFFKRESTDEN